MDQDLSVSPIIMHFVQQIHLCINIICCFSQNINMFLYYFQPRRAKYTLRTNLRFVLLVFRLIILLDTLFYFRNTYFPNQILYYPNYDKYCKENFPLLFPLSAVTTRNEILLCFHARFQNRKRCCFTIHLTHSPHR